MQTTHLKYLKNRIRLMNDVFDLPFLFVTAEGDVLFEEIDYAFFNPLYKYSQAGEYQQLMFDFSYYSYPRIRKTIFMECFLIIPVTFEDDFLGNLILGPTLPKQLSEEMIHSLINDCDAFAVKDKTSIYYKMIPVMPKDDLYKTAALLFALFNSETRTVEDVKKKNALKNEPVRSSIHPQVRESLQQKKFHERKFERKLLSIVRNGDIDALKSPIFSDEIEDISLYSRKSYAKSLKTHVVTLIALVSRTAIESGLLAEEAISLSDSFIIKLDDLHDIEETRALAREMLTTFTTKIHEIHNKNYSSVVNLCREYIYRHIYESIKQEQVAQYVSVSPSHLSTLFKKETNLTMTDYIQKAKIKEAQDLLVSSNLSISEVASSLSFSDQSYFTRTFKKYTNTTPLQFQKQAKG